MGGGGIPWIFGMERTVAVSVQMLTPLGLRILMTVIAFDQWCQFLVALIIWKSSTLVIEM